MKRCKIKEQETCQVEKRGCKGCYYIKPRFVIYDKITNKPVLTTKFITRKYAQRFLHCLAAKNRKLIIKEVI